MTDRKRWPIALLLVPLLWLPAAAGGYPLDGYEATGITRLEAYRRAQLGQVRGRLLPEGAMLPTARIGLGMVEMQDFELPAPDPDFSRRLGSLLGEGASRYGIAVLDLTDRARPRYAEHNARMRLNPGSVGKILVGLSLFQLLADLYPDDIAARRRVLRESLITANGFIRTDSHKVPFWQPGEPMLIKRPIQQGDTASLWTYLDWMLSSSSNAAAAMIQAHTLLLAHYGREYPVSPERQEAYFRDTSAGERGRLFAKVIQTPVTRSGLSLSELRQGSFFTREGKRRVPGTSSHCTSRELLRYLVKLEQGKLVDAFSSLELKRLLYITDRRIRYASSPALYDAPVFYKSGSLYSCRPEPGFACKKYHGNVKNYMNSVAIVETPDGPRPLLYMVVVTSNVLRKNSAVAHQTFATRLHRLIESRHPILEPEPLPPKFPEGEPVPGEDPQ